MRSAVRIDEVPIRPEKEKVSKGPPRDKAKGGRRWSRRWLLHSIPSVGGQRLCAVLTLRKAVVMEERRHGGSYCKAYETNCTFNHIVVVLSHRRIFAVYFAQRERRVDLGGGLY